ncbi:class I SAM-dependent methyltransferase, partial [Staphylococcus epidermidis]|nr:class I SAM-dependent methyltransferase [Staphylococcus epidermidis]
MQIQPEFFEKLKPRYSNNGVFQLINTSILNAFGLNDKIRGYKLSHYYDEKPDLKRTP